MANTQLKFESKIPTVQVVEFTRNHTKYIFKFQGEFYLEGQGHQFSNSFETFRYLINISSEKVDLKFEAVQCLTVKIKIWEV